MEGALLADQDSKPGCDADSQPRDVLDRDDLGYAEKLDILQRWKADLREAGPGNDRDKRLCEVEDAIERLQADVTVDPNKPKGAPSGRSYRPSD